MRYTEMQIEEVISRNDIVDVVGSYVKLTKKGERYFGLCPFHNEKSASFCVTPSKQMFYCFGCHEGGSAISFVMKYENMGFAEAVKFLADKVGMDLPEGDMSPEDRARQNKRNRVLEANKDAATYYHSLLRTENGSMSYNYFRNKRQLSDETIRRFGLGASTMHKDELYRYMKSKGYEDDILKETGLFVYDERGVVDRFRNRAMFPIMDSKNKVIGFGGRVMGEGEPKYLNSPETMIFEKSKNLFGLNYARSSKKKNIIICEGYMDVISMHQAGFDQAVASLGTALTSGHVSLIKRYAKDDNFTKEVLVCYDSDNAGTKAAIKAISLFRNAGVRTRVINMKPYKDPDEFIKNLGAEAFQERIDNAQNSFMFELEILEKKFDLNDPGGKTVFLNEVASKLLVFGDELERNNYIDTVAAKYFVSPKSLQSLVVKYASLKGMNHSSEENEESEEKASVASRGANSSRREKDDGIKQAQRLLLTWLIEDERLYKPVSKYIAPVDFTDSMCYQVAVMLFEQFETGKINPAMIINSFEEEETHREVAKLFNSELPDEMTKLERQKAIDDIVYRVKKSSLDERSSKANDIFELQKIIQEQAKLNSIHIKLE